MKLHMIGNAHIDPIWLWTWQDGFHEIKATFRSALDRLAETDDFVFTCSSASYYAWLERNEPEMFAEVIRRVREGRWVVVGGWWIQPDCNAPCGESFARQGLLGQRYFKDKLGVMAKTAYNVDSFGHNTMLPQIFNLCGMSQYVMMRPMKHEKNLPSPLFRWRSPDGSEALTFRIPIAYCTWSPELEERIEQSKAELSSDCGVSMLFYGVGNHGGGPTKQNIASIHELQSRGGDELVFSSPDAYFDEARSQASMLTVVEGELLHHASGCYSAHSGIKRLNRLAESRLLDAELYSTLACKALGDAYPADELRSAWQLVLFNQFHDILAGTCIREAYDDAERQYGAAISTADNVINTAAQRLSWRVNLPFEDDTYPIVVFNPHAFAWNAPVAIQSVASDRPTALLDDEDNICPLQADRPSAAVYGRATFRFNAQVPPLGYRVYRAKVGMKGDTSVGVTLAETKRAYCLENERIRAEISRENGSLTSLQLRVNGEWVETLDARSAVPAVIRDDSDTWSHGVFCYHDTPEAFETLEVSRGECGAVACCVRVCYRHGASAQTLLFTLRRDADALELDIETDWRESARVLKLCFRANDVADHTIAAIPFGSVERPMDGMEYPMQGWVSLAGAKGGLLIANDGLFAYDTEEGALRLTLLRSPRYANHEPYIPVQSDPFPVMEQGLHRHQLALRPYVGDLNRRDATQLSETLRRPVFALFEAFHQGALPAKASYGSLAGGSVRLTALKTAEDGIGALIARMVETDGRACKTTLTLFGDSAVLAFAPWQIRTVRVENGRFIPVNLLEDACREEV